MFANQEALRLANISHLTAIDTFSGACNGKIKADFYDDCQKIPDPSTLDPMQRNLLLLDDCFLGKLNKAEAYYTRVDTTTVIRYTLYRTISVYPGIQFEKFQTLLCCSHCACDISLPEFKQFCHGLWCWP